MALAKKTAKPTLSQPKPAERTPNAVQQAAKRITGEEAKERAERAVVLADWAGLLADDDYADVAARPGVRINVEEAVPAPIREFVERSFAAWSQEITVNGATLKAGTPKYQHKTFADSTAATEFIRLCHYYAKYRPDSRITVRAMQLAQEPKTVRLAAMPFMSKPRGRSTSK